MVSLHTDLAWELQYPGLHIERIVVVVDCFYQEFVENLAEKTKSPLGISYPPKVSGTVAFCKCKGDLSQTPESSHYQPERETTVSCIFLAWGLVSVRRKMMEPRSQSLMHLEQ